MVWTIIVRIVIKKERARLNKYYYKPMAVYKAYKYPLYVSPNNTHTI